MIATRTCPDCGRTMPLIHANFRNHGPGRGFRRRCNECHNRATVKSRHLAKAATSCRCDINPEECRVHCECGRTKSPLAASCERCRYMDGDGCAEAAVIGALRVMGGRATRDQIMDDCGIADNHLDQVLGRLKRKGRAYSVRMDLEGSGTERGCPYVAVWTLRR